MRLLKAVFSSSPFVSHGYGYMWVPALLWLYVISDSLIALSYFSIPLTLVYFFRKRRDLPFRRMFPCFGIFIFVCGVTHAMDVWTLWHADYWVAGVVKAVTAIASLATAALLVKLVPHAVALPAVTVPGSRTIGLSLARASSVVSGRGCSSVSTMVGPALPPGIVIGTISSAK